jgi:hypothetical protein
LNPRNVSFPLSLFLNKTMESRRKFWSAALFSLGLVLAYGGIVFGFLPHMALTEGFVFSDLSHNLHVADVLNGGGRLYSDVFYNYGLLSGCSYPWWSRLAGNTAFSYCLFVLVLAWIASTLGILALQKIGLSRTWSWVWMVVVLPLEGFRYFGSSYNYLEVIWALGFVLLWDPPGSRSTLRLLGLGSMLVLMLATKFGLVVILGAAAFAVEIFLVARGRFSVSPFRLAWEWSILLVAGVVGVVGYYGYLWFTLPHSIAWTVLWPIYHKTWYASYMTDDFRFPHWHNLGYFVGEQMAYLVIFLLGVASLLRLRRIRPEHGAALALGATYALAAVLIFQHNWNYLNNLWLMVPAAALMLASLPGWLRMGILGLLLVPWMMLIREARQGLPRDLVFHRFPNGESLYCAPGTLKRLDAVAEQVQQRQKETGQTEVIIFHLASGWLHFFQWSTPTRAVWMAPGTVLPEDAEALVRALDRTAAVVVSSPGGIDDEPTGEPNTWPKLLRQGSRMVLMDPEISRRFGQRLTGPVRIDAGCWVFGVKAKDAP